MTPRRLVAAALGAAALAAPVAPALACTIDTCSYTQPVCRAHVVDCSDLNPVWGCTDTVVRRVCVPDPRELPLPPI